MYLHVRGEGTAQPRPTSLTHTHTEKRQTLLNCVPELDGKLLCSQFHEHGEVEEKIK